MGILDVIAGPRWQGTSARPEDHLSANDQRRLLEAADDAVRTAEGAVSAAMGAVDPLDRLRAMDELLTRAELLAEAARSARNELIRDVVGQAMEQGRQEGAEMRRTVGRTLLLSRSVLSKILVEPRSGLGRSHASRVEEWFTVPRSDDSGVPTSGPDWLAARFFFEGATTKEIAQEAGCSTPTVSRYLDLMFAGHPVFDRRSRDSAGAVVGRFRRLPAEERRRHAALHRPRPWVEAEG